MVTNTSDIGTDEPTHDAYGTDLVRVREMHSRGFSAALIAECLGISKPKAAYAVTVATGDRQGAPTPEEIQERADAIRSTWSEEDLVNAMNGRCRHPKAVELKTEEDRVNARLLAPKRCPVELAERLKKRLESGKAPVSLRKNGRWQAHPEFRRVRASRSFDTREEAVAWAREWLEAEARRQVEACRVG